MGGLRPQFLGRQGPHRPLSIWDAIACSRRGIWRSFPPYDKDDDRAHEGAGGK